MAIASGNIILSSDIGAIQAGSTAKPLVSLIQATAQSIPNNTNTAITYTTEQIDTNNYHDSTTNNTRITPSQAGYYLVTVNYWTASSATLTSIETFVRLNGTTTYGTVGRIAGLGGAANNSSAVGTATTWAVSASAYVPCNGSTDYIEHCVRQIQASGAAAVNTNSTGNAFSCGMTAEFVRGL